MKLKYFGELNRMCEIFVKVNFSGEKKRVKVARSKFHNN